MTSILKSLLIFIDGVVKKSDTFFVGRGNPSFCCSWRKNPVWRGVAVIDWKKWRKGEKNQLKKGVGKFDRKKGVTPIVLAGRYFARSLQAIFKDEEGKLADIDS